MEREREQKERERGRSEVWNGRGREVEWMLEGSYGFRIGCVERGGSRWSGVGWKLRLVGELWVDCDK